MSAAGRILVTPRSLTAGDGLGRHSSLEPLRERGFHLIAGPAGRTPGEDELIALLTGVVGWLAGVEPITDRVLTSTSHLRAIARNGTGADNIDLASASTHGVQVMTAPGVNAQGVAELATTLTLAAMRDVVRSDRVMKAGGWERTPAREFAELRVGVVGYGAIGQRVAGLFTALGAEVRFFDPFAPEQVAHTRVERLTHLVEWVNVLSLHAPPSTDGSALVDATLLGHMADDTILVNTARSALVDPEAVANALDSGRLRAYAVDAFDTEPPELDRLLRHDRTLLTPHAGGYTEASVRRATDAAVSNLVRALGL